MNYEKILDGDRYYTASELRYDKQLGFCLNAKELEGWLDCKDTMVEANDDIAIGLGLKSFNSRYIYYILHPSILGKYREYIELVNEENVYDSSKDGFGALVYSELEGSINIEGYNSTRALYDELISGRKPVNRNECVIRNISEAIKYIKGKPEFNRENMRELYRIVSRDCIDDNMKLGDNDYWRNDVVYISSYCGAPVSAINSMMDSLFGWFDEYRKTESQLLRFMIPYVVHYYVVYVHPYFDCNGRMARLCSIWVSEILGDTKYSLFVSESVNNSKSEYYRALSRTRDSRNDLTFFIQYMLDASIKYAMANRTVNIASKRLAEQGNILSQRERNCIKRIAMCSDGVYFTWRDYIEYIRADISKQGALKMLNRLEQYGLLSSRINNKKEKIFVLRMTE